MRNTIMIGYKLFLIMSKKYLDEQIQITIDSLEYL